VGQLGDSALSNASVGKSGDAAGQPRADDPERLAAMAIEVRAGAKMSIGGMAIMAGVLVFVRWRFAALVDPAWLLTAWLAWMWGAIAFWAGAMLLFYHRRPDDAETVARWTKPGLWVQSALNFGIAACPWVLLPGADAELQYVTTLLYVWYVATTIMTSNSGVPMPVREVVLLTVSNAGFALWKGGPYSAVLALFVVMIGLTMLGFRRQVRQAAVAATAAQVASERAEATAHKALAAATAQRDAKTRFIAAASHDLQQPIHAASLFFDVAIAMPDGIERQRAIAGAHMAFESTQALLAAMLDHLRLEAGAVRARLAPVDLGAMLARAVLEHGAAARAAGMVLRPVASRLWVTADADLLRRSLGNLVGNAVRHARGERVLLAARRRGDHAEIWVIDDGHGVAAGDVPRLFDDFAQGSDSDTAGFGLGLASVRRQCELMGGSAALDPRWRGGAAFVLRLPLAAVPALALAAE
jgi:signal transduction histidine kinase